ncbi:putative plant UBX domain-containing protein 14 [Elaeis guineensis]|uniref:putative plant UBX domain-containing protein 14 n=1 Tax=Elaeis guineensis var. tenera TaxID=51953 RepID=UPI003C6D7626
MWLKAILISVAVREGSKKRIISNNNEIDTEKDEESSSSSSDCKICTEKDNSSNGKFTYPILAEEPEPEGDRKQLCRLLWSFYCTQFDKGETRPFRFTQAIPGKTKNLDYESNLTFVKQSYQIVFQNVDEESRSTKIWESNQRGESTSSGFHDNLSSLFREPSALIYHGPFFKAKVDVAFQDRWLLVNLQCTEEFSSHLLNRDLWSNETVAQAIQTKFIFWQMYRDSDEGKKVCTYYNLVSLPAVLIIDPITGQKMHEWSGMIQAEQFLELLLPFMDVGPKEHIALPHKHPRENVETSMHDISGVYPSSLLHHAVVLFDAIHTPQTTRRFTSINIFSLYIVYELSLIPMRLKAILISVAVREGSKKRIISNNNEIDTEKDEESCSSSTNCNTCTEKDNSSNGKFTYPILAEEPEPEGDRKQLCRVGIRLPDGRRLQRNFHHSDPVKLLWSFFCTQFDKGETQPFRFTQAIPGKTKNLDYECNLTFGEAELSDCVLWLTFE